MDKSKILILADYGHGSNCPGKCSPDKSFYEWKSNREKGRKVMARLSAEGYRVLEIWPYDHEPLSTPGMMCSQKQLDAALNWRWKEVNRFCEQYGTKNCICISFHSDAAKSDGKWHDARGFTVRVGTKASAASKKLARMIYEEAEKRGLKGNRCVPPEKYWVQSLAMCNRTKCPAVLTESLFYDNREDLALLTSEEGTQKIVDAHVAGIKRYIDSL